MALNIKKQILGGFLALSFLAGCTLPILNPGAKSSPAVGGEPGVPASVILFSDNFNTGSGVWRLIGSKLGSKIAYEHQGLRFSINEIDYAYWSTPGKNYADAKVIVSASRLGGSNDNYFGVICRFQAPESYYGFLVSSDGYYGILKVVDGRFSLLGTQNMEYSDVIIKDRATNRVRGDCIGDSLTLYVNAIELETVKDEQLKNGDVGLIAGSHEIWGVDILFDDFVVYQP